MERESLGERSKFLQVCGGSGIKEEMSHKTWEEGRQEQTRGSWLQGLMADDHQMTQQEPTLYPQESNFQTKSVTGLVWVTPKGWVSQDRFLELL